MIHTRVIGIVLLSALGLAAAQDSKDLLKGVKAPAGFEVTLFGAPPEVGYPTCLSAAPNGELFVGVDENGSIDAKPDRGRVLRCIDSDGDGRADKINVFAKMDSPRGIVWDDGVLYVQHPPFVTAFFDDDGDGVADRSEVLVKGLGFDLKFRGADHTTNGMRLGIDGWLYIAVGDYGFVKAVGKDGTELQLHGGGVVRVRTDGSGLELYTQGQRNIYDVAVDPFLNAFTRDNTNDGGGWDVRLSHLVPTAHFGYPSLFKGFGDEIVQPLADYGGGSPCGSLFLDEPGLPGGLYTCEWGRSAVFHHPLTPNGASFKAEQKSFVEIQRPTDMDVDARSRLYISSWKNGGFTYSGPNVGFVARVAPAGAKPPPFPELKKAAPEMLLQLLASASHVARLAAQREILRRREFPAQGIEALLLSDAPLAGRVAALFTLVQARGTKAHDALMRALKKDDLREFALRALAERKSEVPSGIFVESLADPNPRVRLQAAVGLGRLGRKEAGPDLVKLLSDPDPLVVHVVVNALVSLRATEACLAALDAGNTKACRVLQGLHEIAVVDGLLERRVRASDPAPILKALCRLYTREAPWDGKWWGTRPDTTGPYYSPVKWEGSERIAKALSSELAGAKPEALRGLLVDLQKNRVDLPEAGSLVLKLAAQDPSFRPVAVELLASRSPLPAEAVELFASVAVSEKDPAALRARAARALVRAGAATDAVVRALAKPEGELQPVWEEFVRDGRHAQKVDAFIQLAAAEKNEVAFGVLARLANAKGTPKEARAAASAAVERAWAQADALVPLLRAVGRARENGYAFQVLTFAKDTRPDVKKAAAVAADQLGLNKVSQGTPIAKLPYEQVLAEAVKEKGDPKHGAALFARQGCGACHTVSADEPPKGPFLGGIATRYSRAELIESILKPSAKIAQGFETQGFKLANDDVVEGFVSRESGDEVEVRTVQGTAVVIPKKSLQARVRRELSVMPTGLADALTSGDLASLLAYLESLKSK